MSDNIVEVSASNNDLVLLCTKYGPKIGFPELKLTVHFPEICKKVGENTPYRFKEHYREYWLAPFRNYCYQISGDANGDGCFGDTPILGLHNLFHAILNETGEQESNARWGYGKLSIGHASFQIFKALAFQCLDSFCNWGSVGIYRYYGIKTSFSGEEYESCSERGDMLDRYTMAVLIYLAMREGKYDLISAEDYEWYFNLPRVNENGELLEGTDHSTAVEIPVEVLKIMHKEVEA